MDDCVAFKTSDSLIFFGSLAAFHSGVWHWVGHARGTGYLTQKPCQSKTLYTVQVGAFNYLNNARFSLEEAQAAGFDDAYSYES